MSEQVQVVRPLGVIEAELDLLERDTQQKEAALIENYIEVGRRLEEVKAQLDHGQWGPWLEKRGYPQPKAIKLMKVFRAYGKDQQSLFGTEAKSKAFSNLGFHKLVQLLAIEDEAEREDFVAEHDVENMSTRELEKALKERDEALKEAAAAREDAKDIRREVNQLQEQMADKTRVYEAKLTSAGVEIEQARADANAAEDARSKMAADMKVVKASLKDQKASAARYKTEADGLRAEVKELKARPVEVAVETREPSPEELEKLTAQAVEEARSADREKIASMEKQLATADGDVAAFRVHYEAWQESFNKMAGYLAKIDHRDTERAGKLRMAVKAAVERMAAV